jgi:hypothetical protein
MDSHCVEAGALKVWGEIDMSDAGVNVFIRASREDVFKLIMDTSRHGEYVKGYVDQMSGPRILSQGTEHIWRINLYGTIFRVYSCVSLLEYPRMYQERIHIPGLFRMKLTHILDEAEQGVTFTCRWEFEPVSWSATGILAERLMNGRNTIREMALENIEGMRRLLEGNSFVKSCNGGEL